MVRDCGLDLRDRPDSSLLYQAVDEFGVVDDVEVSTEVRVLVLDSVEAVGADRYHGLDVVGLHGLDILLGEHLVQVLVTHAAGRVAGARLLVAEDSEVHTRPFEN